MAPEKPGFEGIKADARKPCVFVVLVAAGGRFLQLFIFIHHRFASSVTRTWQASLNSGKGEKRSQTKPNGLTVVVSVTCARNLGNEATLIISFFIKSLERKNRVFLEKMNGLGTRDRRMGAQRKTKPNEAKWIKSFGISDMLHKFRKRSQMAHLIPFQQLRTKNRAFFKESQRFGLSTGIW